MSNGDDPDAVPLLDPQALMSAATAETGLTDYGGDAFAESLAKWLVAVSQEARLSHAGIVGFKAAMHRNLVNRLRFQDDLDKHPEILDEDVSDPIVITGLPRTGTTKLQRMMSCDPGVQKLAFWKLLNPARLTDVPITAQDPRIAIAQEHVALLEGQFSPLMAAHPFGAEDADEEIFLMEMIPDSWFNTVVRLHIPRYYSWWVDRPRDHVYLFLRRMLQYLQWQDGGRRNRPWVLKSPAHVGSIDLLSSTFPGATIVQCHRDLTAALPSTAGIVEKMRLLLSDRVNPLEVGEEIFTTFAAELARNVAQREELGDVAIVDVSYSDLLLDAPSAIRRIYATAGRQVTDESHRLMSQWESNNIQHKHGRHSYTLERYGYTKEHIEEGFAPYLRRFRDACGT